MDSIDIDRIVRSRRRTFSLEIERDGRLVVRAPQRASMKAIREVAEDKRQWIERKREVARKKYAEVHPKRFVDGERFLYLGSEYLLSVDGRTESPLEFGGGGFVLSLHYAANARNVFVAWYKERMREKVTKSAERYASLSGIRYNEVKVTGAQRRWGSCSPKGVLCFSWRLAMAPPEVIDYVVVHELVHIKHPDHSTAFWRGVESIMPDFKKRRRWLSDNGHRLML